MNLNIKKILNLTYYILPPMALIYVFAIIGFKNILETLFLLDAKTLMLALLIKMLASSCRVVKYNLINCQQTLLANSKLFLSARVGSELSILGHFSPMLHDKNRNMGILISLIIDRYLEIFSTILIATVFSFLYIGRHWFFLFSAFFLSIGLIMMMAIIVMPFNRWNEVTIIKKIIGIRENIRNNIKTKKRLTTNLLLLSILASALEFYLVVVTFQGLNEQVEFGMIAIIWAVSGIVSNLVLVTVGPAEITSIWLLKSLSAINASAAASSLILGKIFTAVALFLIYLINVICTYLAKQQYFQRT